MKRAMAAASLGATLLLMWLYPRLIPSSVHPPATGAAINAARAFAASLGLDPADFHYTLTSTLAGNRAPVVQTTVTARHRSSRGRFTLALSPDLRPLHFNPRNLETPPPDHAKLLALFAAERAACFTATETRSDDIRVWKCGDDTLTVETSDGQLEEVRLNQPRERDANYAGENLEDAAHGFGVLVLVVLCPVAFGYALKRTQRRRPHFRLARNFTLAFVALCFALLVLGLFIEQGDSSGQRAGSTVGRATLLLAASAAAFGMASGAQARAWLSAALVGSLRILEPRVAAEVLAGLALGPVLALLCTLTALSFGALPSVVELKRLFDSAQFTTSVAALPTLYFPLMVGFATLGPWLARIKIEPRLRRVVEAAALVLLTNLALSPVAGNGYAALFASTLCTAVLWWAYHHFGALAALAALPASTAIPSAAMALALKGPQAAGVELVPFLGAVVLMGVVAAVAKPSRAAVELLEDFERRNANPSAQPGSERERLLAEFSLAREAQRALLPTSAPALDGFSIAASCTPASEVGGDLYDFLAFPDGRIGFCVADVSGKGVTASLYATLTKGMLAALVLRNPPLKELAAALNQNFLDAARRKSFVTLAVAALDARTRRLEIVRLGHNPPLIIAQSGEARWLKPSGLGAGLASSRSLERVLEVEASTLEAGDTLILYSDGLVEAMNPDSELFGDDRLVETARAHAAGGAQALANALLAEVERFRSGAAQNDDLTLVVVEAHA